MEEAQLGVVVISLLVLILLLLGLLLRYCSFCIEPEDNLDSEAEYRRRSTITLKDEDNCSNGPPSAPDDLKKIREHPVEAMFDSRSIFLNVIEELEASQAFLKSQNASS